MKKSLFMVVGICLCLVNLASGVQASVYQADKVYPGLFVPDRIYIVNRTTNSWSPDDYKTIKALKCKTASVDLATTGQWVGNLDNAGGCNGTDEAPTRAMGNYLNYLQTVETSAPQAK